MIIKNNFLILEDEDAKKIKLKKITGHRFVDLLGLNKFKLYGDALLEICGLIPSDKIDPKWLKRGDFAEKLIYRIYERDGHKCITYDKKAINYDNFPEYQYLGGMLDIDLVDENTLIEVKSKSMKDYEFITKNPPKAEIYQGLFYGRLKNYKEIIMEWVFFDKPTEDEIFLDLKPITLKNIKHEKRTYTVNNIEIEQKIEIVQNLVNGFLETKKVSLDVVSDKVLDYLKKVGLLKEATTSQAKQNQTNFHTKESEDEMANVSISVGAKFRIGKLYEGVRNGDKWQMIINNISHKNDNEEYVTDFQYCLFPSNILNIKDGEVIGIKEISRVKTEIAEYNGKVYPKTTVNCVIYKVDTGLEEQQQNHQMAMEQEKNRVQPKIVIPKEEKKITKVDNDFSVELDDDMLPF